MAQLTCFVRRGDEPLRISWSLKGDIISSEPSITTTMIGTRTSMLMISNVGYRHSGTYTCTASNRAGSQSYSTELLVNGMVEGEGKKGVGRKALKTQKELDVWTYLLTFWIPEPPDIVPFSFGRTVVNEGEYAQVTCSISKGDEPLKISWCLKGDVISSEPSLTTTMIGTRTSILIISSVGYRHSGHYTCHASNKAGSAKYTTELLVNG